MMKYGKILAIFILLITAAPALAKEKIKIIILDFIPINVSREYAEMMRTQYETRVSRNDDYILVERGDVDLIAIERRLKEKTDEVIKADIAVTCYVEKTGDRIKLTYKVVDINSGQTISSFNEKARDLNEAKKSMNKSIQKITKRVHYFKSTGKSLEKYENYFSANLNYLLIMGDLNDLFQHGYGFDLSFGFKHLIFQNSLVGMTVSYYSLLSSESRFDKGQFIPLLLDFGYNLSVHEFISFSFLLSPGVNILIYDHGTRYNNLLIKTSRGVGYNFILKPGAAVEFTVNPFITIQAGSSYSVFFEQDGHLNFMNFFVGAKFVF